MNARIINLRTRRKQKARSEKTAQADANALKFGRTKAERAKAEVLKDQETRHLDGHKLDKEARDDDD